MFTAMSNHESASDPRDRQESRARPARSLRLFDVTEVDPSDPDLRAGVDLLSDGDSGVTQDLSGP